MKFVLCFLAAAVCFAVSNANGGSSGSYSAPPCALPLAQAIACVCVDPGHTGECLISLPVNLCVDPVQKCPEGQILNVANTACIAPAQCAGNGPLGL